MGKYSCKKRENKSRFPERMRNPKSKYAPSAKDFKESAKTGKKKK